mmetsp:Transcript_75200/g.156672  ORF Transcript_75200/g.156672 Transcript_75200/m.156672 type:complete len:231 (-) Transcript_75200:5-697(-)
MKQQSSPCNLSLSLIPSLTRIFHSFILATLCAYFSLLPTLSSFLPPFPMGSLHCFRCLHACLGWQDTLSLLWRSRSHSPPTRSGQSTIRECDRVRNSISWRPFLIELVACLPTTVVKSLGLNVSQPASCCTCFCVFRLPPPGSLPSLPPPAAVRSLSTFSARLTSSACCGAHPSPTSGWRIHWFHRLSSFLLGLVHCRKAARPPCLLHPARCLSWPFCQRCNLLVGKVGS